MPRNPKVEFDMLQLYYGRPYVIDLDDTMGKVTVYSPTIGDIITMGEARFFRNLNVFITNTTQYRLQLWEMNVDWCLISDFDLFVGLYRSLDPEVTKLLFGDLDFSKFEIMHKKKPPKPKEPEEASDDKADGAEQKDAPKEDESKEPEEEWETVLYDQEDEIEINYDVYNHFAQYLRTVFGIFPEEKITKSDYLKEMYITKDRKEQANKEWKEKNGKAEDTASIQATISACINHPGFKYKLRELEDVGVAEFYDSVRRLQVYEQTTAALKGIYSGFVDGSKVKPEELNFMKQI